MRRAPAPGWRGHAFTQENLWCLRLWLRAGAASAPACETPPARVSRWRPRSSGSSWSRWMPRWSTWRCRPSARSGRRHQRPAVGRGRVHADVRGAASVGGCAGRPDRRPTRVRCRGGGIRAGLGGLRPGARPGCAGRRPAGAGCGGRGHDAVVDGPDRTGVPRSGPAGAGGGHVGDGRRGRILGRPGHGRAADPGQLAADLFHQRPGRRGSAGPAGPHLAVAAPPGAVRLGRAGHRRAGDGRADLRRDRSRDGWPGCPRGCWPHSRSRGWVWPCSWPSRLAALIR
jgi:hypothetical protein